MRYMLIAALLAGCGEITPPRCHVEAGYWGGSFELYRDRPLPLWDRQVGLFHSVDEAVAAGKALGCEVSP